MNAHRLFAFALCTLAALGVARAAEDYPNKPIRMVVPFPPGAASDFLARVVSQRLGESFNQQVVVDNRPGGGGVIGGQITQRAAPDGYTLSLIGQPHITAVLIRKEKLYDPIRDFTSISEVATMANVVVLGVGVPAKSLQDLIALARSKPGQLNFGSAGVGSSSHLAAAMFNTAAGIQGVHIPFKVIPDIYAEMLAGRVHYYIFPLPAAMPLLKEGKLRAVAVGTPKRTHALPDVPTMAEAGLQNFESESWFGVIMPAGASKALVNRLSAEIVRIVGLADTRDRFLRQGAEPRAAGPAAFAKLQVEEVARIGKVVRDAGVTPQ